VDALTVHLVGDVMYDSARHYASLAESRSRILEDLGLTRNQYILATIHRAENTDDPARLEAVFNGCSQLAREIPVVLPLHPRTRNILRQRGLLEAWSKTIRFIEPVGYLDMVRLESGACLIATDSGGVQKEAFFFQVPCVTLRDETEWVELVQLGWNRLAPPTSASAVAEGLRRGLGSRGESASPYGDGAAAPRIVQHLETLCP
jgi:UDP-GlcNAc3NAcA epimerase